MLLFLLFTTSQPVHMRGRGRVVMRLELLSSGKESVKGIFGTGVLVAFG